MSSKKLSFGEARNYGCLAKMIVYLEKKKLEA